MIDPFITGRAALAEAEELLALYGDFAAPEAARRADCSRTRGNVVRYCHWRQIERLVALLDCRLVNGTIH